MNAIIRALQDPSGWSGPSCLDRLKRLGNCILSPDSHDTFLILTHASGLVLRASNADGRWTVFQPFGPMVAIFASSGTGYGARRFRRDLDAAYGPRVRARWQLFAEKVLQLCLQAGYREEMRVRTWFPFDQDTPEDETDTCMGDIWRAADDHCTPVMNVPQDLAEEFSDLKHVRLVQMAPDGSMISLNSRMRIAMPASGHTLLRLLDPTA